VSRAKASPSRRLPPKFVFFLEIVGYVGGEIELLPRILGKKRVTKGLRVAMQPQMMVACTSIVDQTRSLLVVPIRDLLG
jgi:hypothetical protein